MATPTPADESEWGPRLYNYLEKHWRALNTNANAWTDRHPGLQGPTVSRWRTGTVPRLQAIRAVADALDVPLVDVLVGAGILGAREANREAVPPPETPNIDAAIAHDPNLTDLQRRTLRDILAAMRQVEGGEVSHAGSRTKATSRRKRSQ